MHVFPAYTVELIDRLKYRDFVALLQQAMRKQAERRNHGIMDMAYAVRIGMADADGYRQALQGLQ
jgi:hypothetical protein